MEGLHSSTQLEEYYLNDPANIISHMLIFERKQVNFLVVLNAENYFHLFGMVGHKFMPVQLNVKVEGGSLSLPNSPQRFQARSTV